MSWTSGVVRHVLPTGLTLLVQRDDSSRVVAVVCHVKAGYFDEPDEWVGISHVLEHMFFKGTRERGPGQIAREIQALGGFLNASTIYDKTVYYVIGPSTPRTLERVLDVQANALTGAALDADELARELEVIVQEAKRKLDTPGALARESLYELLFRRHRMRRWRIGTEAGLRKLTAADVRAYYTTRYVPSRVIVGIVGNLEVEETLALAERAFGDWSLPDVPLDGSPSEPNDRKAAVRVLTGDVERALALVGWRTEGVLHRDTPALDLAATILGHGRGSRLYRSVRTPGLASSASAVHYTPTEVGAFDVALEGEATRIDEAIQVSLATVRDLGRHGPAPADLERARALIAADWARQFETMDGRAMLFCHAEALGGYQLADELYDRVMTASLDDVRRVTRTFLDPALACGLLYLPEAGTTKLAEHWPPSANGQGSLPPPASGPRPANVRARALAGETTEYAAGVTHFAFPGADVLVRPKRGSALVSVLVHLPGVPQRESSETAGLSRLTVRASLRGAGGMTADELALAAERLGGGMVTATSADGLGWGMTVRAEALAEATELLRRVALEPSFAEGDLAVERDLQASDARRARDDMFRHPVQRVLGEAYPGDRYGIPIIGTPDSVRAITDDLVREWGAQLRRERAVVVAVGDLDARAFIEGLGPLALWPGAERATPTVPPRFSSGRGAEDRDKAQSALAMAFPSEPYGSPGRYAVVVACALLSGLAGRLFHALREQRSLAYTVAAMPWLRRRAGVILTYIATSPEREDEARARMLEELERLATGPIGDDELDRARQYAAGSVEIAHQRGGSIASDILDAWVYGVMDEFGAVPDRYRAVSAAEVQDVARGAFIESERAEFTVRGQGKSR